MHDGDDPHGDDPERWRIGDTPTAPAILAVCVLLLAALLLGELLHRFHVKVLTHSGAIMLLAIVLFEKRFVHVVAITFTSLILTELLMVANEVTRWHPLMLLAQVLTLLVYLACIVALSSSSMWPGATETRCATTASPSDGHSASSHIRSASSLTAVALSGGIGSLGNQPCRPGIQ